MQDRRPQRKPARPKTMSTGAMIAYGLMPFAPRENVLRAVSDWNLARAAEHRKNRQFVDEVRCIFNAAECDGERADLLLAKQKEAA